MDFGSLIVKIEIEDKNENRISDAIATFNGKKNDPVNTDFSWIPISNATGYKLNVGASPVNFNIFNSLDVGNVTTSNLLADIPGDSSIYVKVVPGNSSGEALNYIERSFSTDCSDLIFNSVVFNSYNGTALNVSYEIKNIGTGSVPPNTTVALQGWKSEDNVFNEDAPAGGVAVNVSNLPPNGIISRNFSHTIDTTIYHYFIAQIDASKLLAECNEDNNILITRVLGGCLDPDAHNYNPDVTVQTVVCLTCFDAIQNGDENGVDCGGVLCPPCNGIPSCTQLLIPEDGAMDVPVNTNLTWDASPEATGYRLTIGTTTGGTDIVNYTELGNVTTYNPPVDLPPLTTIFVTIVPYNSGGNALGCIEESFTTKSESTSNTTVKLHLENNCNKISGPPPCISLTSPLNYATDVSLNTTLNWYPAASAVGYIINVGTSNNNNNDIIDSLNVGNVTSYNLTQLPCNTIIFVSITPYNIFGESFGCLIESFATQFVDANAGSDVEINIGESTQLSASGGTKYVWSPSIGLDNHTIANPIASPGQTTIYSVTVYDDEACFDTDDVVVAVNTTSTSEIDGQKSSLKVYPNPNNGKFHIVLNSSEVINNATIYVYDLNSRPVYSAQFFDISNQLHKQIDLTELPSGSYFVKVTSENHVFFSKLFLNH